MLFGVSKRLLVGRPVQSDRLGHTLLPKKIALPVFASDALSSVAYATEEILIVLSVGGLAFFGYTPWIALGVGLLMLVVVASYRQNVHAYPSGGGDYEVATTNLGPKVGMTVASALMVDYTLTVAVSVTSGVANLASAFPALDGHLAEIAVAVVAVIALLNLRGVRESGTAFAIPTYLFIATVTLLIIWGLTKVALGDHLHAVSDAYRIKNAQDFTGFALVFLVLRAFSSGCTALTGVEAISNGVPAFKKPKSKNAATTLALLGGIAVAMFGGITALALMSHVHAAASPSDLAGLPAGTIPPTVIAQVGQAVFGASSPFFYVLQLFTALILVLAANTAFNGFPVLASILARDGFLPRQLRTRGDRLAYSNGILLLSGFAIVLIIAFNASPTRLIQLYIVGVFVSFVCSQTGMIRHWNRNLKTVTDTKVRLQMMRSRAINTVGACVTAVVLVIVVVSKFAEGAWIAVAAMGVIWLTMRGIQKHYEAVALELAPPPGVPVTLPSSNVSIVLVSKLHLPTLRALAYARATRPARLEAITVDVDEAETARLKDEWEKAGIPVPLTVVTSPYRDITQPVIAYVKRLRLESPRDIVTVFIPEYVLGHWWEQLLHNQSALRLKARLINMRGVVVASVPYQLRSSQSQWQADPLSRPGAPVTAPATAPAPPRPAAGDGSLLDRLSTSREDLQAEEMQAEITQAALPGCVPISQTKHREVVDVTGTLRTVTLRPRGPSLTMEADLWDGTGNVTLVWLGRRDIPGIEPGRRILVHGRLTTIKGEPTIFNPQYELRPSGNDRP
ncbi:MAG TPA: amino acid permease [Streptosporangiaceae bacterium]|nr:amino acid permease [Streptosporangiaceae bacterium]